MSLFLLAFLGLAQAEGPEVQMGGYVAPAFKAIYRPYARPVDQERIGMDGSKAGLLFQGKVTNPWRFNVHLVIGCQCFDALTSATPVDADNNGTTDAIRTETAPAITSIVEEATTSFVPVEQLKLRVGQMRIPFTSQAQSANTKLMFPERSGPNEVFLQGTDLGGLMETDLFDGRILGSVGVFNGTGSPITSSEQQGVLYTARMDLNPLGSFGFNETSEWKGPFRIGVGAGMVHNPYTAFDEAGYPTVAVQDTRSALSGRLAFYGLYISGEYLIREQLDSMSRRPIWATGWYGQTGFHLPLGFEPMARMGEVTQDESFDARQTRWIDAGLNYYPARSSDRPDRVKLTVHYLSENRITEGEHAQGLSALAQITW
jgi:hypothetical protein